MPARPRPSASAPASPGEPIYIIDKFKNNESYTKSKESISKRKYKEEE